MPSLPNTITLCGFSGAGKTIIAQAFANTHPDYSFIDLDSFIEEKYSKTVAEIFASEGEKKFREYEQSALRELFNNTAKNVPKKIIALGGGSLVLAQTRELVKKNSFCIYLKCSVKVLYERIAEEGERKKRPLVKALVGKNLLNWVTLTLAEREPYYLECADAQVDTTIWNEPFLLMQISETIKEQWKR